ncbi:MAG: hypothetical protein KJ600_01845 [Nanoarchaeota archaeon]|nr:hypothetical protein [Nanoarchaeota archaeon]MBU1103278.1 hypothetical protein [Nanoarchaeota archaeon]
MPEDTTTRPSSQGYTVTPISEEVSRESRENIYELLTLASEDSSFPGILFFKEAIRDEPNTFLELFNSTFPVFGDAGIFGEVLPNIPGANLLLDSLGLAERTSPSEPTGYHYEKLIDGVSVEINSNVPMTEEWLKEMDRVHQIALKEMQEPIVIGPAKITFPYRVISSDSQPTSRPVESQPTSRPTPPIENYSTTAQSKLIFGESEYDGVPLSGLEQAVQKVTPKPTTQSTTAPTYHPQRDLNYLPTIGITTCLVAMVACGALYRLRKRRSRK